MGLFKMIGSGVAYPLTRAYRDVSSSFKSVGRSYQEMRDERREKHEAYEAARELLGGMSEQQKFQEIYELNGWDEEQLQEQMKAARRTRLALLCTAAAGMSVVIGLTWFVKWWVMMLLGPVGVIYLAACAALSVKYAWFEYQLEVRSITPIKAFLSRPDLFSRVFG